MSEKKLLDVLLIDDSEADNYIHKRIIEKADIANSVTITHGAREALDYLVSKPDGKYPQPDLIFLDINMPDMSGWDFLDEYETLDSEQKADVVVCMLTTSYADSDREKANKYDMIHAYSNKPLTAMKLNKIISEKFPNFF